LLVEKLPFCALSIAGCVATLLVQQPAIRTIKAFPLSYRVSNALVSCVTYLGQVFYPARLCIFYPAEWHPPRLVGLCLCIILGTSLGAFFLRKRHPYLLVGWLWYLVMLLPVIGLVQVGAQARADRYTYLPHLGVYTMAAWACAAMAARAPGLRLCVVPGAAVWIVLCASRAHSQTHVWQDSESLWRHALTCTGDNELAHANLGNALLKKGQVDEAITHFEETIKTQPNYADAQNELGYALLQRNQVEDAIPHLRKALELSPQFAPARNNYGMALLRLGRTDEAIEQFEASLKGDPTQPDAHSNLGAALLRQGRIEGVMTHYERALALKPDHAGVCNNLAWVLATFPDAAFRNGSRAVELAERANRLSGGANLTVLRTLAAAYAEAGRFGEAMEMGKQALAVANAQNNSAWANALRNELQLYAAGQPLRDTVARPP
jgi:tetratricopeptide (TPR) repeat protein